MTVRILRGDVRDRLKDLPDESVHCVVTSPPYWSLRDYGHAGQIGLEDSPNAFVDALVGVFREVRRVLRSDGTAWVNMGDSYCSTDKWGGGGGNTGKQTVATDGSVPSWAATRARKAPIDGIKPKDLMGMPWALAFAMRADGWYLRQDIIWSKPNAMPESIRDRCTKAHEYIFLFSKANRYYYDMEGILEAAEYDGPPRRADSFARRVDAGAPPGQPKQHREGREDISYSGTRNKRSVWTVPTAGIPEAHFATFPPALIEPCILAGCPVGGTVLDPFGGAGTTGLVADRLQRDAILIELNPDYADIAEKRIRGDAPLFARVGNT